MTGLVVLLVLALAPAIGVAALAADRDRWDRLRVRPRAWLRGGLIRLRERLGRRRGTGWWLGAWLVGLLLATWAVGAVVLLFASDAATPIDELVTEGFVLGRTPGLSTAWGLITDLGDSSLLVPAAVIGGVVWRRRRGGWFGMQLLVGSYLGASLLFNVTKRLVARARPGAEIAFNQETGLAFPSGHATDSAAFYTAVALLLATLATAWAVRVTIAAVVTSLVVLVGASRLYLAAHWFTDVVWGLALGVAWSLVLWTALTTRSGEQDGDVPEIRAIPVRT